MKNSTNRTLRVGFFVISAIILFVLAIYFIGSKNNLFNRKTYAYCIFNDIRGVVPGNAVRFSGINVGNVKDIEITSDSTVVLTLAIRKDYAKFIYRNSIVEISQDGLMGNKLLLVSSGTPDTGHILEGDTLRAKYGIDIENMLSQARDILVDTKSTVSNLNLITEKINNGEGDIGALLTKNTLTTKFSVTADNLNSTLAELTEITQKINSGKGDLGKLVNTNEITTEAKSIMTNLRTTSEKANNVVGELNQTAKSINSGDGTVSLLLNNANTAKNVDTTILKVNSGLDQVSHTLKTLENSWIMNLFNNKTKNYPPTKTDSVK
ncbi:Mammalian cell entry related domain protein [uncultured Paludibacter sp.]|nr:Mammalian cell entry related domain protein [uncultured Paludibacter sp.]